jgi:hypothetical protein
MGCRGLKTGGVKDMAAAAAVVCQSGVCMSKTGVRTTGVKNGCEGVENECSGVENECRWVPKMGVERACCNQKSVGCEFHN